MREMVFQQGCSLAKSSPWLDAWAAYRPKGGQPGEAWVPVRPREDRALWRDFPAFFLLAGERHTTPTYVLRQWAALREDYGLSERVRYEAVGLRTDMKAKVFAWRHDAFDLAPGLLTDGQAQHAVERCLTWAEAGAEALRAAVRRLHPLMDRAQRHRAAVAAALKAAVRLALHDYWTRLEGGFLAVVADPRLLAGDAGRAEVERAWRQTVGREARRGLAQAAAGTRATASDLARVVHASRLLACLLSKIPEGADA